MCHRYSPLTASRLTVPVTTEPLIVSLNCACCRLEAPEAPDAPGTPDIPDVPDTFAISSCPVSCTTGPERPDAMPARPIRTVPLESATPPPDGVPRRTMTKRCAAGAEIRPAMVIVRWFAPGPLVTDRPPRNGAFTRLRGWPPAERPAAAWLLLPSSVVGVPARLAQPGSSGPASTKPAVSTGANPSVPSPPAPPTRLPLRHSPHP